MALATTDDVAVPLLRPLTVAEVAYAERLIDWAEIMIKGRYALADLDPAAVVMVEAQAVARVLRNPGGVYTESLSGEYSATRDRIGGDGQLRITDEEWALLAPAGTSGAGAFSVDTAPSQAGVWPPGFDNSWHGIL